MVSFLFYNVWHIPGADFWTTIWFILQPSRRVHCALLYLPADRVPAMFGIERPPFLGLFCDVFSQDLEAPNPSKSRGLSSFSRSKPPHIGLSSILIHFERQTQLILLVVWFPLRSINDAIGYHHETFVWILTVYFKTNPHKQSKSQSLFSPIVFVFVRKNHNVLSGGSP